MKKIFLVFALLICVCSFGQDYYFSNREVIQVNTGNVISREKGSYRVSFSGNKMAIYRNGVRQYIANWVDGNTYWHTSRNKYLEVNGGKRGLRIIDRGVNAVVYYY